MFTLPDTLIGGSCYFEIVLKKPSDGVTPINADTTPTAIIIKNGNEVSETINIDSTGNTGGYKFNFTPEAYSEGDIYIFRVSASITDADFNNGLSFNHVCIFCTRIKAIERGTNNANTIDPPTIDEIRSGLGLDAANLSARLTNIDNAFGNINVDLSPTNTAIAAIDAKLSSGRLSRIDRLPDINAGSSGGLSLVGSEMNLTSTILTQLFADADVTNLVNLIAAKFDGVDDLPIQTIAAQSAAATVVALVANGAFTSLASDASAAKTAAQSVDAKVPGTVRTATQDSTAETNQTTAIRSGLVQTTDLATAKTEIITALGDITVDNAAIASATMNLALDQITSGIGLLLKTKMPSLAGPYLYRVCVLDSDTEDEITGALVRLWDNSHSETQLTETDGYITGFTVASGVWNVSVRADGYTGTTQQVTISANATLTIELTANTVTGSEPGYVSGTSLCLDENGDPEEGVVVWLQMVEPSAEPGYSFDGTSRSVITGSNGIAQFANMVPGATYNICRDGGPIQRFVVPADAESPYEIPSYVGTN